MGSESKQRPRRSHTRRTASYWPHLLIVTGGALTLAGAGLGNEHFYGAAANLIAIGAIAIGRRKQNERG
jgi:hypothetical protein